MNASDPDESLVARLRAGAPVLWCNPQRAPCAQVLPGLSIGRTELNLAAARWERFAPLLQQLFDGLRSAGGRIESPLLPAARLARALRTQWGVQVSENQLWIKADHRLPVGGSIKARGGIYAVLHEAERRAVDAGLWRRGDDIRALASDDARALFADVALHVASTGNLALSVGVVGAALGFQVVAHVSAEAKQWKKARLRSQGVEVVEHGLDYSATCQHARRIAASDTRSFFVDDERSRELFLGYAVAAFRLAEQLAERGVRVDAEHPLFLYLPCGVGGAPGGITFGAKHVFGDAVHCFFVEPTQAPCMTLGLSTGQPAKASVLELGLRLDTVADGLAVDRPSALAAALMKRLVSGCCTVTDDTLHKLLCALFDAEGLEVEPSAVAGCAGPLMLFGSEEIRDPAAHPHLASLGSPKWLARANHIIWTTGGALVPAAELRAARAGGAAAQGQPA